VTSFIVGWVLCLLTGGLLAAGLLGWRHCDLSRAMLIITLAVPLGLGVSSLSAMAYLLGMNQLGLPMLGLDLLMLVMSGTIAYSLGSRDGVSAEHDTTSYQMSARTPRWFNVLLPAWGLLVIAGSATLGIINLARRIWGDWDAVMIWNLRARFFFRIEDQYWLSFEKGLLHTDYPLYLPLSIYRLWTLQQFESPLAPQSIALLMTLAIPLALGTIVGMCRGRLAGIATCLILLANPYYLNFGTLQLADVPIGGCLAIGWGLMTLAMLHHQHDSQKRLMNADDLSPARQALHLMALAGAMWGCMIWIKNEGLMLLLVTMLGLLVAQPLRWWITRGKAGILAILAGMGPWIIALIVAKLYLSGSNDLVRGQSGLAVAMSKMMDLSRHQMFWIAAWNFFIATPTVWVTFLFFLLVPLAGWRAGRGRRVLVGLGTTILLAFLGYYTVYMLTPHDLEWHLRTSLSRIMTQLWPVFVFWAMMGIRLPWPATERFLNPSVSAV